MERNVNPSWKVKCQIGSYFLSFFPTKLSTREVGHCLGYSKDMIRKIEQRAAFKIVVRMQKAIYDEHLLS